MKAVTRKLTQSDGIDFALDLYGRVLAPEEVDGLIDLGVLH